MDVSKLYQRTLVQFLTTENTRASEIYREMQNGYGTECMSSRSVFRWYRDSNSGKRLHALDHFMICRIYCSSLIRPIDIKTNVKTKIEIRIRFFSTHLQGFAKQASFFDEFLHNLLA